MNALLTINNLSIEYSSHGHTIAAVNGVTLAIAKGKTLGLVGKSGCGKSTVGLAIMGLLPEHGCRITSGSIFFQGRNLLHQTQQDWQKTRGKNIAMVFQDPFSSLNPVFRIEDQIQECIELEKGKKDRKRAEELLNQVQLKDSKRILNSFPHQLSGGQRQRVMIACALARNPELLIADEPTTALDVTVQAEIMNLLWDLQQKFHMSVLFITHNMGLVKGFADELAVMFKGEIVEQGPTNSVLYHPQHPYTKGLLGCIPKLEPSRGPIPLLAEEYMEA